MCRTSFFLILLIGCLSFVHGDVASHLKKIHLDGADHSIRNVDCIYLINLDQRPEKYAHCVAELAPYGIHPFRFSAVNGWELSFEAINDLGVKLEPGMETGNWGTSYFAEDKGEPHHEIVQKYGRTYFCHCMARGTIGISLSHLSILQDAYDRGFETIWVMEDDIQILQNPHLMSQYIDDLNELFGVQGWDVLFTDRDTKNQQGDYVPCTSYGWKPNYSPRDPSIFEQRMTNVIKNKIMKVAARYGAYSMIVNRPGMKKILDFIKEYKIFLPYDMEFYLPEGIQLFSVQNDVVSTLPTAVSDNGGAAYLNK